MKRWLSRVYVTRAVSRAAGDSLEFSNFIQKCLLRFSKGDWGEMDPVDIAMNDEAVQTGDRILASYRCPLAQAERIWIITEGEPPERYTTILFPEDY